MADITAQAMMDEARRELDGPDGGEHPVTLDDVRFSRGAQLTIGFAVKEIAERCGLFPGDLTRRLRGRMYWMEGSENLMIVFPVPEVEAEMLVEIPRGHWWFKDAEAPTQ